MTKKTFAALLAVALAAPVATRAQDAGSFKIPGTDTTLRFNAFAEMGLVYVLSGASNTAEFYQTAAEVTLDSSAPDPKLQTRGFGVAYTRFGLSSNTPSKVGAIGMRIEGDFGLSSALTAGQTFTNSKSFRVRHAYGTVGDWLLLGQTWSTFADLATYADQADEFPTVNLAALRAPMVRLTLPAGPAKIQIAAENPYASLANAAPTRFTLPDLIGRVDFGAGPAALSVRGVVRQYITDDPSAAGDTELSAYGFGGAVGAALKFGGDTLALDASYGSAFGVYQYGNYGTGDFVVVTAGGTSKVEKWKTLGLSAGFTHVWNGEFRSNLIGSLLSASGSDTLENGNPGANKQVIGIAANTIYSFAKNAWVGVEVWYNSRTTFATATPAQDNKGSEFRVLGTTHFDLF